MSATVVTTAYYRAYELPWSVPAPEADRFRRILRGVLGPAAVLALLIPWLPVPERESSQVQAVPPRLARLMLEQRPLPPPPPPPVVKPETPKPKPEAVRPVEKPEPVKPVTVPPVEKARERAAASGVLPFADKLAALRDNASVGVMTRQGSLTGASGAATVPERALITARSGAGSSGINTAAMSRDAGGAGLGSRETTRVASTAAGNASAEPASEGSARGQGAGRSREEIEMVFDQNKGAIYALYNRALRSNPSLQGKLVLKLTIEASGEVSAVEIVSSELQDEELERKLVQRVKMFRFAAKDVPPVTTTKPIDFFPA